MVHYYNSALRELDGRLGSGGRVPLFVEVGFGVFSLIVDEIGCCFLALFGFFCDFWFSCAVRIFLRFLN